VRTNFVAAITKILILAAMLLSGCTTYVAKVKKEDGYTKRLTETSVLWTSNDFLTTRITRSARGFAPTISERDKEQTRRNISDLQALFSRELPTLVSDALQQNSVTVRPPNRGAATSLIIIPNYSESECTPLGCKDSLWLRVQLLDVNERKMVWTGSFKVGAPSVLSKNDVAVVKDFADTLVSQLRLSELL
jgi:hypothetical protein